MDGSYDAWVGRVEEAEDVISPRAARQLLATLGESAAAGRGLGAGDPLPPLWHWLGWQPEAPMAGLGPDGHPARGGFLPPVALERRMWAGGRLRFRAPLRIGMAMHRRSEIVKISEKTGSAGRMVFVTLRHDIAGPDGPAVEEEQDIVYVAMPDRFAPPPPQAPPADPAWSETVVADTVRLFRFSALTFNAHRIHFDLPYATDVERYPGLVVHGPLQAILLAEAAQRHAGGRRVATFRFRGVRPAFHFDPLTLCGTADGRLATVTPDGAVCMTAEIGWEAV